VAVTKRSSRAPRVRSGASHRATLVTTWEVRLAGIEFIDDLPMVANGHNKNNTDPDRQHYPAIHEDFEAWGRGMPLTGWDWEGKDNLERAACYKRLQPVHMKVKLRSTRPAPTDRTFTLKVTPTLAGNKTVLKAGTASVNWPAASQEQIISLVALGGALPNEVSRYHLHLTWSVTGITPGGTIKRTNHEIFGIFDDPRDPDNSSAAGTALSPVDGLTKQRLDKVTLAIGGAKRRFPTPAASDLEKLVWHVGKHVNDHSPPRFYGGRSKFIRYGVAGPTVDLIDQWVMWLQGRKMPPDAGEPAKPWNVGACISYAQLMKTMLASVGVQARRAWVYPKTNRLPDGSIVLLTEDDLIFVEGGGPSASPQKYTFHDGGLTFAAEVKLIGQPEVTGPYVDNFEACLYFNGRLIPGAFRTQDYPPKVRSGEVGFPDVWSLFKWWQTKKQNGYPRFMLWFSQTPRAFFDVNGTRYDSPYDVDHHKWLPMPHEPPRP
jgi:hypothetical protein